MSDNIVHQRKSLTNCQKNPRKIKQNTFLRCAKKTNWKTWGKTHSETIIVKSTVRRSKKGPKKSFSTGRISLRESTTADNDNGVMFQDFCRSPFS